MEGNEEAFFRNLSLLSKQKSYSRIRYLEFGVAEAGTFSQVCRWFKENHPAFCAIGIDLPDGWSMSLPKIHENMKGLEWVSNEANPYNGIHILFTDARAFMGQYDSALDFVFIDACHGRKCAKSDFLCVARYISKGGIVAFHDTSEGCQGIHPQVHCGEPISVRQALKELGLLDGELAGWKLLEETQGVDGGHGMMFFQFEGYAP